MHTLKVILAGVALLGICLAVGRFSGAPKGLATAAIVFLPLWLVGASLNMYFGVTKAGYSVADEFPVLLLVFAVPAALALGVWFVTGH